jgi:antitoxin component of RelBE/YafQ-DinJ toxin-antitoxin module
MRLTGHAYPWDVLGDPGFLSRTGGLDTVALASAYHSVRAATPLHPSHQLIDAPYAALYRPVRESVWRGRRLRPLAPTWMSTSDSFGEAADVLRKAGLTVSAWIVLTHNSRLGTTCPDVAVVNCFGDRYPYALCPSRAEVREYAATLAAEAAEGADEVSLEACGQLGVTHQSHHEKTDNAWTPTAQRWLSVCCCDACQKGWSERGLDPSWVLSTLREAVRTSGAVPFDNELLAVRQAATDQLRAEVLANLSVPVTLHAHPDPWVTGSSPGLTPTAGADVAALVVQAWSLDSAPVVEAAVATGRPVDAYVSVLQADEGLAEHAAKLVEVGATGLAIYHLGLAPRWRQPLISEMIAATR